MIDWTVRAGDVLVVLGFMGTILSVAFRGGKLITVISLMQNEIVSLKRGLDQVNGILQTIAVQKKEIEFIHAQIDELKHGRGLIRE